MPDRYCLASGLVVVQAGDLTASAAPASPQGPLTIRPRGAKDLVVPYDADKGMWRIALAPGAYVVSQLVPDPKALNDKVTLSPPKGSSFVYLGPKSNGASYGWAADEATITRGDPKNPWPPPQAPEISLGSAKVWFDVELAEIDAALPKDAVVKPRSDS